MSVSPRAEEVQQTSVGDIAPKPSLYDGWEWDQELRHIHRVLEPGKPGEKQAEAASRKEIFRLDPPHVDSLGWHINVEPRRDSRRKTTAPTPVSSLAALTWVVASLGIITFACGGILLGWSVLSGRGELWTIGMPITMGGQIALLVGLILQLDRLWLDSRRASAKLDHVDAQIHDLKRTTTLLGTTHSSPATAFYSHLAGGAGPEVLLADLKSQLDLLAVRMAKEAC